TRLQGDWSSDVALPIYFSTHDVPPIDPGSVTCFCEFCQSKAKERGINVERAKQGFLELEKFVRSTRSGIRPVDGYYVQFWRLLFAVSRTSRLGNVLD